MKNYISRTMSYLMMKYSAGVSVIGQLTQTEIEAGGRSKII